MRDDGIDARHLEVRKSLHPGAQPYRRMERLKQLIPHNDDIDLNAGHNAKVLNFDARRLLCLFCQVRM